MTILTLCKISNIYFLENFLPKQNNNSSYNQFYNEIREENNASNNSSVVIKQFQTERDYGGSTKTFYTENQNNQQN